jgi:hypothetical protein
LKSAAPRTFTFKKKLQKRLQPVETRLEFLEEFIVHSTISGLPTVGQLLNPAANVTKTSARNV